MLLDGVDLARQPPRITRCFPAQYLSGHAQVIGWVPLHPGSARVDEPVSHTEDCAPVVEQRLCDQPRWLPDDNGQPGGDHGGRRLVAVGLESGNGTVNESFDQLWACSYGLGTRIAEGEEDGERCYGGGSGGPAISAVAWWMASHTCSRRLLDGNRPRSAPVKRASWRTGRQ